MMKRWRQLTRTAAVEEEHNRMVENEGWTPVPKSEVPVGAKVLTSSWAKKKKANGTFRARLNDRGFEQVPGIHYDPKSLAAPVVSLMTIRIVFVLMIMANLDCTRVGRTWCVPERRFWRRRNVVFARAARNGKMV
jgi:hypothetical protein